MCGASRTPPTSATPTAIARAWSRRRADDRRLRPWARVSPPNGAQKRSGSPVSVPEIVKRETFDLVQHPPAPGGAPRGPFGHAMGPRWRTRAGLYGRAEGDWSGGGAARLAQSERGRGAAHRERAKAASALRDPFRDRLRPRAGWGRPLSRECPRTRCSPQCWSTKPGECSTSPGRPYRCRERSSRCSPCWLPSAGSSGTRLAARITAAWKNPERKRGRAPVGDHRAEDQWRGDGDRPGRLLRVLLASKAQALEQEIELRRQFPSTALTQVIHRLLGRDQVLSEVCYLQATPK